MSAERTTPVQYNMSNGRTTLAKNIEYMSSDRTIPVLNNRSSERTTPE